MAKWNKLAHVVYQCSYHIVWTPQYRYRILEGDIAKAVEEKILRYAKYVGRKRINGGEEVEEVWPIVEAILLQVTTFGGGN